MASQRALRVGVGGPVGCGKSSLIAELCRALSDDMRIGVVTNDIYTTEDAQFLRATGVLPEGRIVAVQTGCCPHTAIRDDITINLEAVEQLEDDEGPLDLVLVESGGDNLTAVFSPALADVQIRGARWIALPVAVRPTVILRYDRSTHGFARASRGRSERRSRTRPGVVAAGSPDGGAA